MKREYYWVGLSSETKPTAVNIPAGSLGLETDTGDEFMWIRAGWVNISKAGAQHVIPYGISGASKDMAATLSSVSTRKKFIWAPGAGPKVIFLTVEDNGTIDPIKFCVDPDDDLTGDANLVQAYSAGDSSVILLHKRIKSTTPEAGRVFYYSQPIQSLYYLPTVNHTLFYLQGV
jgi:hypothetical protein